MFDDLKELMYNRSTNEGSLAMFLYHGTDNFSAQNIIQTGIDFQRCDRFTDNARGFYLSKSIEFAEERAKTMTFSPLRPVVIRMNFDEEKAMNHLNIRKFEGITDDWRYFVAFNRSGLERFYLMNTLFPNKIHNLDFKYDVVVDIPADARISSITDQIDLKLADFDRHEGTTESYTYKKEVRQLIHLINTGSVDLKAEQYSFHTRRSLRYLENPCIIDIL